MKRLLLLLFVLGFSEQSRGQTSDVSHFYIIYDVSGSVGSIDRNNNLQQSLFRLLDIDSQMLKLPNSTYARAVSFSLYPFGEGSKSAVKYDALKKSRNQPITISELKKRTDKKNVERFSDLVQALDSVMKNVPENDLYSGVFIFTDGSFSARDLDNPARFDMYKSSVDSALLKLKQKLGSDKVFIIQTSQDRPIFQFANIIEPPKPTRDSIAYSDKYFWIDAQRNVSDERYTDRLADFFQQALALIATNPYLPLKNDQEVAITLQEIWSVDSTVLRNILVQKKDSIYPYTISKIWKLDSLLKKSKWTKADINDIKNYIRDFSATSGKSVTADSTSLNSIKQVVYKYGLARTNSITSKNADKSISVKSATSKEPLSLMVAYTPAASTVIVETVREAKRWENLQQRALEGMADYIIKRSKMELTYAFIDNIKDWVFSDSAEMRDLFPETAHFVEKRTYDILALKDAVRKDLNTLPERIFRSPQLVKSQKLYSFWAYLQLYDILLDRGSLEEAFAKLKARLGPRKGSSGYLLGEDTALIANFRKSSIGSALLLSINLISYLNENDFARAYDLRNPEQELKELSAMLFVLALDTTGLEGVKDVAAIKREVATIYRNYNLVKKQVENLQGLTNQTPTADFEGYRKYQKDLLMDILRRTASLLTSGANIIQYIDISKDAEDDSVYQKPHEFISALNNGVEAWFELKEGNYAKAMFSLSDALLPDSAKLYKAKHAFLTASGEIANVSSAEEVSNIIARYTLPVASHKTKKVFGSTVMLTAYAGITHTWYNFKNDMGAKSGLPLIAAIGPEFSYSWGKGMSISIMGTLLDLGNIVHFRLRQDSTKREDVSFARAFSPGALVAFAPCHKVPLAITVSAMSNPWRYQLGITLDLPLLGIYKW